MSEEEITGMLRLMQERIALALDILTRMESRQLSELKKETESEVQGKFGTRDQ